MAGQGERPLVFLDVDGTIIPTDGVQLPTTLEDWYATWQNASNPHLAKIDRAHGSRLLSMPCDLVWATAWMADANAVIGPILGLPELPVADFGELPGIDDPIWAEADEGAALNWKTRGLVELAAGRPFAWVDDELTVVDRAWISAHHHGQALLRRVNPDQGLADADLTAVEEWVRSFQGARS
jgi:hypothetical protein